MGVKAGPDPHSELFGIAVVAGFAPEFVGTIPDRLAAILAGLGVAALLQDENNTWQGLKMRHYDRRFVYALDGV